MSPDENQKSSEAISADYRVEEWQTIDLRLLDKKAAAWDDAQCIEWLRKGFELMTDRQRGHLAFPPLRFYPAGRIIEQMAAVIDMASQMQLQNVVKISTALTSALKTANVSSAVFGSTEMDGLAHHLAEAIGEQAARPRLTSDQLSEVLKNG